MAEGAEALAASVRDFVSGQQDGRAAELAAGTGRGLGEAAGLGGAGQGRAGRQGVGPRGRVAGAAEPRGSGVRRPVLMARGVGWGTGWG